MATMVSAPRHPMAWQCVCAVPHGGSTFAITSAQIRICLYLQCETTFSWRQFSWFATVCRWIADCSARLWRAGAAGGPWRLWLPPISTQWHGLEFVWHAGAQREIPVAMCLSSLPRGAAGLQTAVRACEGREELVGHGDCGFCPSFNSFMNELIHSLIHSLIHELIHSLTN